MSLNLRRRRTAQARIVFQSVATPDQTTGLRQLRTLASLQEPGSQDNQTEAFDAVFMNMR